MEEVIDMIEEPICDGSDDDFSEIEEEERYVMKNIYVPREPGICAMQTRNPYFAVQSQDCAANSTFAHTYGGPEVHFLAFSKRFSNSTTSLFQIYGISLFKSIRSACAVTEQAVR